MRNAGATLTTEMLFDSCRARLPAYMVPARVHIRDESLPRNPNGKIDRKMLASQYGTIETAET
jgi:acyl-CoA synthetase (AMP-forming)/AMP-acid ligase II